jgi:hypothetical protein
VGCLGSSGVKPLGSSIRKFHMNVYVLCFDTLPVSVDF